MNGIEEHFYETAAREVASKQFVPGLMAKAFSECNGDEKKTIARYIKYRVGQLQEQFAAELDQRRAHEQERKKDEERRRDAEIERARHRAEQEKQQQTEEKRKIVQEELRRHLSRDERICPHCDAKYRLSDYRLDVTKWYCSFCKTELPRE